MVVIIMKFSKLEKEKLTDEDCYDLLMSGVVDYADRDENLENNPDFLIVLGCSPQPLKARVLKMLQLYKKGYGKYVLFSGGKGWHKLFKPEKRDFKTQEEMFEYNKKKTNKYKKMKKALRNYLFKEMDDPKMKNPNGKARNKYMGRILKRHLEEPEAQIGYKMMKAAQSIVNIPDENLFFEQESMNTVQNLNYSKKLLDTLQSEGRVEKIKSIMVITSCFHCRRAELSFRKYFGDNINVMTCPSTMDLISNGRALNKESLLSSDKYVGELKKEIDAIINYTNNKSIVDCDIEDYIKDKEALARIMAHQNVELDR